jgi:hypothetical protein
VQRSETGGSTDPSTAKNPNSSASGKWQITDPTLAMLLAKHPELRSLADPKNDPATLNALTQDNAQALRLGLGRPPNQIDLIAAHFLGAAGAVKFLTADPATPVDRVVSPDALAANKSVFYNANGQPKTVGQVYQEEAAKVGQPNAAMPPGGTKYDPTSPGGQGAVPQLFQQQGADIASYIKSQPAMWDRLAQMQADYLKSAQPTPQENIQQLLDKLGPQWAANNALMHSNAGGILLHADPSNAAYIDALKNQQSLDLEQQAQRMGIAKTAYELGSGTLLAQNKQALENLGLTGDLAKNVATWQQTANQQAIEVQHNAQEYTVQEQANAINAQKNANELQINMMRFGQERAKEVSDYIEKSIPNPETRAKVAADFFARATPNMSLADSQTLVQQITKEHQDRGEQVSAKEPAKFYDVTTFDPDTGAAKHQTVNGATPEGQKLLANLPPGAKVNDLGAPTSNVTVTNAPAGTEGNKELPLADQHLQAIQTKQSVDAANQLLAYIQQHGDTGILTDSDEGKAIRNVIRQATGIDTSGLPAREVFGKLMTAIQLQQAGPGMKTMGPRPSQTEFQQIMKSQLGATATSPAVRAYLDHVGATADWNKRLIEFKSTAAQEARRQNNTYFDPDNAQIQWQSQPGNQPPVWNTQELTTEPAAQPQTRGPAGAVAAPASNAPTTPPNVPKVGARSVDKDGNTWVFALQPDGTVKWTMSVTPQTDRITP